MPTLLAARGIAARTSRSQSRSRAFLYCVLPHGLRSSPRIFEEKRDCWQSTKILISTLILFIWESPQVYTLNSCDVMYVRIKALLFVAMRPNMYSAWLGWQFIFVSLLLSVRTVFFTAVEIHQVSSQLSTAVVFLSRSQITGKKVNLPCVCQLFCKSFAVCLQPDLDELKTITARFEEAQLKFLGFQILAS